MESAISSLGPKGRRSCRLEMGQKFAINGSDKKADEIIATQ